MPPDVSVVIPTYQHAHFLGEAIESARRQRRVVSEVVVVDDGSTDETATVVQQFPGIRYLRQEHRGLPAARNAGLRACSAAHVIFLDADDRLLPDAAAHGLSTLRNCPDAAFVSGEHRYIDRAGVVTAEWRRPPVSSAHYEHLLRNNYIGMVATVLFTREALLDARGFDESLPACEDYDLYLRITRRRAVSAHAHTVAEYRRYGAAMSDDPARMLAAALEVLRAQRSFAASEPRLQMALEDGVAHWRRYYGSPLRRRVSDRLAARHWRAAFEDITTLARYSPGQLTQILWPAKVEPS